jgi:2-polyprenyl-3-methyl-5-hydroxy-6-metoxy-1,4-benzoquinol methylase
MLPTPENSSRIIPNEKTLASQEACKRPENKGRKPRLTRKQRDEHFAAHIPGVLNYHALMLADEVRNKLLYKAIRQSVNSETSFLDVGAGTGVWAILAAKLGAKRVVAIEIEECLIPLIYKHAQENGVADRIEIIHANSKRCQTSRKV